MANAQQPDIGNALSVQGGRIGADTAAIEGQQAQLSGITNEWASAQAGLNALSTGPQAALQRRASGQSLTGGYWANRQSETQNAENAPQTMADLGRFLLSASKRGSLQASQAAQADVAQQQAAAQQANQIQNSIFQTRQAMQQADMNLSNQKFSIWQTLNNANNSMQNAQASLHNNYVNGLAQATSAAQAISLQQDQYNINTNLGYIGAALGAASSATAGWAAAQARGATGTTQAPSAVVQGLMTNAQNNGYLNATPKLGA